MTTSRPPLIAEALRRAADNHLTMAAIGKPMPKPKKEDREKKHKASPPRRQILCAQIEAMSKQIVFWRDGCKCVESAIDGVRCAGGNQWGHYIPRSESRWLKYDLGNTYCQCRNHNNLHDKGSQTMGAWFSGFFGERVSAAMQIERDAHRNGKDRTLIELEELLDQFDELFQNRYFVNLDLQSLIAAGYYGDVIKNAVKG